MGLDFAEAQRTVDGGLTRQLLEHLGGTGEPVTRLADGNVKNQLLDLELPHGVLSLLGRHCCGVVVTVVVGGFTNWLMVSIDGEKKQFRQFVRISCPQVRIVWVLVEKKLPYLSLP